MNVILRSSPYDIVSLAVARSLGKKNIDVTVFSTQEKTLATYSKYCKNSIVSPDNLGFFSTLSRKDVVFPLDETSMLELSKNKDRLRCLLAFSEHRTLETVMNKSRLVRHAIEQGIPCPETVFIDITEDIQDISLPMFPVGTETWHRQRGKGCDLRRITEGISCTGKRIF